MAIVKKTRFAPKDFFLYVAAMAALYVSTISLLTLYFQLINAEFPDALNTYVDPYSSSLRFAVAALIVIYPLYVFFTRLVNQDLRSNPEKRDMGIRKWLIYLTLFIAGATVVGDLVILVNTFLGGEITTRFILKVLAVFIVIGGVFLYYFSDLKGKWEREEAKSKSIAWGVSILVAASLIGAFLIMGSPEDQRLLRFDSQKVSDLQSTQSQILEYWRQKEALPKSLDALQDPLSYFIVPKDPQTGEDYEYAAISDKSFELCANFNLASLSNSPQEGGIISKPMPVGYDPSLENWQHGEGRACFERTIDPEKFPPYTKAPVSAQ